MSTKRKKRHSPEQIVKKLRDADAMLNAGQDLAVVLQALEVSEQTYYRWRNSFHRQHLVRRGRQRDEVSPLRLQGVRAIRSSASSSDMPGVSPILPSLNRRIPRPHSPRPVNGYLRSIKSLEYINGQPVAEFWKAIDGQPIQNSR